MRGKIEKSISLLENWIEKHNYKGYEPFDGLSSYFHFLTFHNWFTERVLQQLVLRFPFHIRPFIGVKPEFSTKGMGFFARGSIKMWQVTKDEKFKKKAEYFLNWLIENHTKGYSGVCWGNHFNLAGRPFQLPKHAPTEVWVSLIGQAFLDGYEAFGEKKYLEIARSACDFILKDLPRIEFDGSFCISYVTFKKLLIHNANMLGAGLLARTFSFTKEPELFTVSKKAMRYACNSQQSDGSWYYGEEPEYNWIDNWHTAYNLDGLKCFIDSTGDKTFEENLKKGFEFYKTHFFEDDGKPKFYHDRLRFVDIQCSSQAIDTLCYFSEYSDDSLELALKVANWTIENMQDKKGYFYYRDLGWKKIKVPMLHWGQATMFESLSHLLLKLQGDE